MLKFRLSVAVATFVVLGLATQVNVFAVPQQSDNPSEKSLPTSKSSKKKKKKKTVAAVPYVIMPQQVVAPTVQAAPVVVQSVEVAPATPEAPLAPTTRNVSRATKSPALHVTPTVALPEATTLVISEFRVRGPNGANDEFIEIYNGTGADHTVAGGGSGYAVVASDGTARCVIPNGTVIPNRGHYLCVNSVG